MVWSVLIAQSVPVGEYVSVWKVLPVLILTLIWARLLTWIDKDAPAVLLPREMINVGMIVGFVAAFALFFVLPGYHSLKPVYVFEDWQQFACLLFLNFGLLHL